MVQDLPQITIISSSSLSTCSSPSPSDDVRSIARVKGEPEQTCEAIFFSLRNRIFGKEKLAMGPPSSRYNKNYVQISNR